MDTNLAGIPRNVNLFAKNYYLLDPVVFTPSYMHAKEGNEFSYFFQFTSAKVDTVNGIDIIKQVDQSSPAVLFLLFKDGLLLYDSQGEPEVYFTLSIAVKSATQINAGRSTV